MWEAADEVEGEGEEERLCLWREVWSTSRRCPFVEARDATELDTVAGPEMVDCSGAVSSTSCRRGWRSCRP